MNTIKSKIYIYLFILDGSLKIELVKAATIAMLQSLS